MSEQSLVPSQNAPLIRSSVLLMPVMDVPTALARLNEFQSFCAQYLQESQDGGQDGGDYGVIPGTKKKTLLKSGAEKLCEIYGLSDEYEVMTSVENWDTGLFDYTLKCILKSRRDDSLVGTGVGSCSTFEAKYRWREQQKTCPKCGIASIIKGKTEYGGGWLCWKKKGGCDAKFSDGDRTIESQPVGRIENPDIIDAKNTALKMAKKRAKIDAVIGVTRSSGIFTQDMEDAVASTPPRVVDVPPQPQAKASQAVDAGAPIPRPMAGAMISEAQAKRLFAIAKASSWTNEQLKAWLQAEYQIASTKDIKKSQYAEICEKIEKPVQAVDETLTADDIFTS